MGRPELGLPITGLPEDEEDEFVIIDGAERPRLTDKQLEKQKHLLWMLDASIKEEVSLRRRTYLRRQVYRFLVWAGFTVKEESWGSVYEPHRLHLLHFFREQIAKVKYDWSYRHWEQMPTSGGSWCVPDAGFDQHAINLILNREPRTEDTRGES